MFDDIPKMVIEMSTACLTWPCLHNGSEATCACLSHVLHVLRHVLHEFTNGMCGVQLKLESGQRQSEGDALALFFFLWRCSHGWTCWHILSCAVTMLTNAVMLTLSDFTHASSVMKLTSRWLCVCHAGIESRLPVSNSSKGKQSMPRRHSIILSC